MLWLYEKGVFVDSNRYQNNNKDLNYFYIEFIFELLGFYVETEAHKPFSLACPVMFFISYFGIPADFIFLIVVFRAITTLKQLGSYSFPSVLFSSA